MHNSFLRLTPYERTGCSAANEGALSQRVRRHVNLTGTRTIFFSEIFFHGRIPGYFVGGFTCRHGTSDVNVPFLESVWLMDEALKKHKGDLVSFMIYPGEFHYFSREHVLRDAWQRVDQFFDTWLRAPATSTAAAKPR